MITQCKPSTTKKLVCQRTLSVKLKFNKCPCQIFCKFLTRFGLGILFFIYAYDDDLKRVDSILCCRFG